MLSGSLNSMFESLNIAEDCYGVGHFSRLLATDLASHPQARARRKTATSQVIEPAKKMSVYF